MAADKIVMHLIVTKETRDGLRALADGERRSLPQQLAVLVEKATKERETATA